MTLSSIFFARPGVLRSGWRLLLFSALFLASFLFSQTLLVAVLFGVFGSNARRILGSLIGLFLQNLLMLICAVGIGWLCARFAESRPFDAVGWAPHRLWLRNLLLGSAVGGTTLAVAAVIVAVFGGFRFTQPEARLSSVMTTLLMSLVAFVFFGAAEEALFRGYPLQTLTRAGLAWVGILLTSLLFASAHLANPHTVPLLTFGNTLLAGVWLSVAYCRTGSLWFPLGLHWSWNWVMGSVLGLPVSGIRAVSPHPMLTAADLGPAWLTGGSYGIEGGVACTIALALSTLWIWKWRFLPDKEQEIVTSAPEVR